MNLLFDIGGTNMRFAMSKDGESIEKLVTMSTPSDFDEAIACVSQVVRELRGPNSIHAAAGGVAGILDVGKSWLFYSPNLRGWEKKPLKTSLEQVIEAPCTLENDAALSGLGEAIAGAGKGYKIVAYITVGTGVGGVRVVNEKIDERSVGFEPGHQIIDIDKNGDGVELETVVSGAGIKKTTSKNPSEITDLAFWETVSRHLAVGLNNTILHWSPQIIVLGGGMITADIIPFDKVSLHLKKIFTAFPDLPIIHKSTLKDQSALFGAMQLLKELS
jgi:glucokinase